MEVEARFSSIAPSVFDRENYQIWAVRMETYLDALDLWEALEEDYEIPALPEQFHHGTDQNAEGKEDKEIKGKGQLVCCSLIHHLYSYHVSEVSKGDMGLSQD